MSQMRNGLIKRGQVWYYTVRVTDPTTGKQKTKWASAGKDATYEQAKRLKQEADGKVVTGTWTAPSKVTLGEYLDQWLLDVEPTLKPKTVSDYQQNVRDYLKPKLGNVRVQALQTGMLMKAYADLKATGSRGSPISAKTVAGAHRVLRKALNDAVRDGLRTDNPAIQATLPKESGTQEMRIMTLAQLKVVLTKAKEHRLFAIFHLAAFTGARRGELVALRWRDIDIKASNITIAGNVTRTKGKRHHGTPKSGDGRVISIDPQTVAAIKAHRARQNIERMTAGPLWRGADSDWVFTTAIGDPIYPETPSRTWHTLRKCLADDLPKDQKLPRFHDLRHTHATMLLKAGQPVHIVAARLGHANPTVTLRIYAHYLPKDGQELGNVFARIMIEGLGAS